MFKNQDVYLPDFRKSHREICFSSTNINTLKNSLKPKKNLLYEINPEAVTVFNPKDIFKIPEEKISQNVLKPVQIQINDNRILDTIKNRKTFTTS